MHGEALLDEAREQVVGGRRALAHDARDVVGAHAVRVLLEQAEHLQHGARRRQAATTGVRPRVIRRSRHACAHLQVLAPSPDGTASSLTVVTPRRCICAAACCRSSARGATVTHGPGQTWTRTEGSSIAESLAGHRCHDLSRAARAGSSPCLGTLPRRWPARFRARTDRRLVAPLVRGRRRPAPQGAAPSVADDDEAAARWEVHPLVTVAPLIRECLAGIADDAAHLMVVSDADGTLLWLEGAPGVRLAAANSMNFAVGALWSESGAGTNAIGTALAADHAVQVFAAEHFNEVVQAWTCAAAPVHDPDTGRVLGVIDLTSRMSTVHPHSFAVAVATAGAVEAHLRCLMHERDARLRSRYRDRVTGRRRRPRARHVERPRDRDAARTAGCPWTASSCRPTAASSALAAGRAGVRRAARPRRRLPRAAARARARGPLRRRGPAAPARRRPRQRDRRPAPDRAAPPPGRDPRAAVPAARRPDHGAARARGLRRRGEQQHRPRRGVAAAHADRARDRDRPLPARRPRRVRPRPRPHAAAARRDPGGGRALRGPAAAALRRARASSASATRSTAGCATR